MQFPADLVLLGASAVAVGALTVSGRFLVATAHEMGNPDLDPDARKFMGYWALVVTATLLALGITVTLFVHVNTPSSPQKHIAQESIRDGVVSPDKPTITVLNETDPRPALTQTR